MTSNKITDTKQKACAGLFWVLSAVCMGVIFWMSSRNFEQSTEQSNVFVEWLTRLFGDGVNWILIVRKGAHCLEYTGLSLLLNTALYFTRGKKCVWCGIALTSLYAVTDEVHQLFVEGRSGELLDWAIDTAGAVLGALGFIVLLALGASVMKRRKKGQTNSADSRQQ